MFALANSNEKLISLYNVASKRFIGKANIKHQASSSYYYGEDLVVEDYLCELETIFARTLKEILNGNLPLRVTEDVEITETTFTLSKEYSSLLYFVCVTDFRNPVRKRQAEIMADNLAKEMLRNSKEFGDKMHIIDKYEIIPKDSATEALRHVDHVTNIIADLNYKLLVNHTKTPFITSDYPVVRYNQWLESFVKRPTSGGYGSVGIQLFIPINDNLQILVYDDDIYNVGKPKHTIVNIIRRSDVDQLNLLQFLNSFSNVFGNSRMTQSYIDQLAQEAAKYQRPNGVLKNNLGSIFMQTNHGIRIDMRLSFMQFTHYALNYPFSNRLVYLRPHAARVRDSREY